MLNSLREAVKRLPVVGPMLHRLYLTAFHAEGRVEEIRSGSLKGFRFRRFMHTFTPEYVEGNYEPVVQDVFTKYIRPGQVVYDVGANAGFLTLLAAKLVGTSGAVVAFEPGAETARQLRSQIELNRLPNVTVEEAAVSDAVGTAQFVADGCSVMARLDGLAPLEEHAPAGGNPRRTCPVKTTTLDTVLGTHRSPDLVKVDVEGAEMLVLAGATRLLDEVRPVLIIELHTDAICREFHDLMRTKHYTVTPIEVNAPPAGGYDRFVIAKPVAA